MTNTFEIGRCYEFKYQSGSQVGHCIDVTPGDGQKPIFEIPIGSGIKKVLSEFKRYEDCVEVECPEGTGSLGPVL